MPAKKDLSFEQAIKKLNEISEKLSDANINLDEALKLYAEGAELIKSCNKKIEEAEAKIKVINSGENND